MKLDMNALHYVALALAAAAAAEPKLQATLPPATAPWLMGGAGVCLFLSTVLGVFFTDRALKLGGASSSSPSNDNDKSGGK